MAGKIKDFEPMRFCFIAWPTNFFRLRASGAEGQRAEEEKLSFSALDLSPLTLGPEKSGSEVRAVARAFTTEQAKRACFFWVKEQ